MSDKIPEVDMLKVARSACINRRAVLGFVPQIGLPIVDYDDVARIDAFYLECQNYRDYYRDPYNKVHKPLKFQRHLGKCGIKLDTTVQDLRKPIRWVEERPPPILPINYKSNMNLGIGMDKIFRGRYNKDSCMAFNR